MDYRFLSIRGVFSYARAVVSGASPEGLRRAMRRREITRLHHGWYCPGRPRDDVHRHQLRLEALLQEYDGQVVASHGSALVDRTLPLEGVDLSAVHLMWREPGRPFQAYSRTHIHERLPGDWFGARDRAVDASLAAVQVGMRNVTSLLVAADAGLRSGAVSAARMLDAAHLLRGQRGITGARAAIPWCDGRHESPGETLAALLLRTQGFDVIPQVVVDRVEAPGRHYVVDFLLVGPRVVIEFDGRGKYVDAAALFAEKQREDELRRLGYLVVRLTWDDLSHPDRIRRRIEAAVALDRPRSA